MLKLVRQEKRTKRPFSERCKGQVSIDFAMVSNELMFALKGKAASNCVTSHYDALKFGLQKASLDNRGLMLESL